MDEQRASEVDPDALGDRVLIIGGGMGGIRAALDLAEAERNVLLVERGYAIGGLMTQLDRTFPTNNCDLCTLSPHLSEGGRRQRIDLRTLTRVTRVEGNAGAFTVTLRTEPRYIDLDRCTACGDCLAKHPECVRFTPGLDHRAPTCMRYPQATPQAFSIDLSRCTDRDGLVAVCPADAIKLDDQAVEESLEVTSIVVAVGAEVIDTSAMGEYAYLDSPNVLTSLEYERLLSAAGPTQGRLVRPSDGRQPERIAWIQCVGSRGIRPHLESYCSSACCMFALKEAMVTKERFPGSIEATVFFMDMRTSGKDYEKYYLRAQEEFKVRFVRCRPSSVDRNPRTEQLTLSYFEFDGDRKVTEEFDLVVLSTGFRIPAENRELAEILGVELNDHGFIRTGSFRPVETSRPGIFACGICESPKDIPETMAQASAAACLAGSLSRGVTVDPEDALPPERDVSGEPPRVGVFICDCGVNIGGVIDVAALARTSAALPDVVHAEVVGHGCSRQSLERLREQVGAQRLNRVVVAGCSPRTHLQIFQDVIRQAGLNRYLVEIANIRDQDAWVHRDRPDLALEKARKLVRMAVSSARYLRPLPDHTLPMNKDVLVVGGGVAGMSAALQLADRGFKVTVAERSRQLGGLAATIQRTLEGEDVQAFVSGLIERTMGHENIQVLTSALVVDHSGMPGMFSTGLQVGRQMFYREIRHGVTILATGALAHRPRQYLLGEHPAVRTQLDVDGLLAEAPEQVKAWQNVVMIQCVGSRTPENPNCSRVCCQAAIKNALGILDLNPEARIFVLYRDMRTPGFQEDYYREARRRGVLFVRYEPDQPPAVEADGDKVAIRFREPLLRRDVQLTADALCLSTGMVADDEATEDLAAIFRLPRTEDGYFLEDHIKLRPVDLPVPGVFVAGTAHAPKSIRESVTQAQAAASRAQTLLARDEIRLSAAVARVDAAKCATCLVCVRACPYGVPFINADRHSEIDPAKCHGCGICAAECPAQAIQLMQFEDDQILAQLRGLLERKSA